MQQEITLLNKKHDELNNKHDEINNKHDELNNKQEALKNEVTDLKNQIKLLEVKDKTKYFCIGRNKTGTTSLEKAFKNLGYIVGDQREAEQLFDKHFFDNRFEEIIEYCKTAEVFQDVPFSHYEIIPHIDKAYPNSKFILTIRDTPEQWYNSITKFHAKFFGKDGRVPTYEDLANAEYMRKGFMTRVVDGHGTSAKDPYNKEIMIGHYNRHNQYIIDYFKDRPDDLLVINLSEKGSYQKFCEFIRRDCSSDDTFPWENKT
ncbi:hypothetical protein IBE34_05065 [Francisella philomiragia]|nr:hypothetical protein [Francisella philomiragia]MBK2279162.1 hypothetical protein [Francisella philomiragia]MBK2287049.1 hypothetical protein [Francisella philomiragia]MBK2288994.1 hypothetical protein [Francisella philomiragia]MBK2290712.1 hypothetical protein [Francisella philomiragia]